VNKLSAMKQAICDIRVKEFFPCLLLKTSFEMIDEFNIVLS